MGDIRTTRTSEEMTQHYIEFVTAYAKAERLGYDHKWLQKELGMNSSDVSNRRVLLRNAGLELGKVRRTHGVAPMPDELIQKLKARLEERDV